jgi:hypothetical protein
MQAIALRIAIMVATILFAAIFFLAAGAFLCVALFDGLKMALAPWQAALAAAGIFLIVALLIIAIGSAVARSAERKARLERERRGPGTPQLGLTLGRILGEEAARYAGKHPIPVLGGAIVTGFLLGAIPGLRSFLAGLIKRK